MVYVAEALSFIIKYKTFEELKTKYRLEEEVKEGSMEEQLIPLSLMLDDGLLERRQLL